MALERLSERELQVVDLVMEGRSNREIGKALGISYRTVEWYRSRAMIKLEAENIIQLVKLVIAERSRG